MLSFVVMIADRILENDLVSLEKSVKKEFGKLCLIV